MQIQINFKVDPQDDNPIIIEKLFQVIFLDSHQHNAPVIIYTGVVVSRTSHKLVLSALEMETKVILPRLRREKIVQPKTQDRTKTFFLNDEALKIWWGRDSKVIDSEDLLNESFKIINEERKQFMIDEDSEEAFRKIYQKGRHADLTPFLIQEADSFKHIKPFILIPGEAEDSDLGPITKFKTDTKYISEHLNDLHDAASIAGAGIGYWVKQDFLIGSKHHHLVRDVEYEVNWPGHLSCRDFTTYFVINNDFNIEDRNFRFIVSGGRDYTIDVLEKNPLHTAPYYREWKQLGISQAKILRFPSSKVDSHFEEGTALKAQIDFKLKDKREFSRQNAFLIIINIWFATIFTLGLSPGIAELFPPFPAPSLPGYNEIEISRTLWWIVVCVSLIPTIVIKYNRKKRIYWNLVFSVQFFIFSIWAFVLLVAKPYGDSDNFISQFLVWSNPAIMAVIIFFGCLSLAAIIYRYLVSVVHFLQERFNR